MTTDFNLGPVETDPVPYEFYIYELSAQELEMSKISSERAKVQYENEPELFLRSQVARQKAWCNLIAQDWEKVKRLRDDCTFNPSQEKMHIGASATLRLREQQLRNFGRRKHKKTRRKTTLFDKGGMT